MDAFDIVDAKKAPTSKANNDLLWNILTILVLLGTLIVGMVLLIIFIKPQVGFNPFPPPTEVLIPTVSVPTPTPTSRIVLPPTWTPEPTLEPSATPTLRPTITPALTDTPPVLPSNTPSGGANPASQFSFVVQQGSPKAIENIYHQDLGCNYMGVGGQVTSLNGSPVVGIFVQLGGTLEGKLFETLLSMTGTAVEYGRGGYEFQIADKPIASNKTLWIQLLDQSSLPLSDKIYFVTTEDCAKALTLINFVQVK
jgi:hypothetical protein